ncbi:MAG: serine/threonine protein kinase [Cyanobacteria bacterium TGS_CYA1]|nr:serine/threonine protein kinase [Cyanobacteria bacterium TGS_CYA1]
MEGAAEGSRENNEKFDMKLCLECNIHFLEDFDSCPNDGGQLVHVENDPLLGKLVGEKYRILNQVGKGSMAIVYKAIQESTGRKMAVKMLHQHLGSKLESVKRFHREAKAVSSLNHKNIIRLYDFGLMPDGQPYIVTEFLAGTSLAELLRLRGILTVKEALPFMEQVCAGVGEAHRCRVIHRDLKPDNIVMQSIDLSAPVDDPDLIKPNSVRVVDFGVSKMWSEAGSSSASLTMEGKVCGSPAYMSPEQCKGLETDYRSDIYSLGIVFFEVLTGQRPFFANDLMALMLMHVNKEPPSIGEVMPEITFPPALSGVIGKALSKNPDDRQRSADELWREIEAACKGKKVVIEPPKEETLEWKTFTGAGNVITAAPMSQQRQSESTAGMVMADWTKTTMQFDALGSKKKKFTFTMNQVKNVFYLCLVVFTVQFLLNIYSSHNDTKVAKNLLAKHNYEGCIQVLETIEKKGSLTKDAQNDLDTAYLKQSGVLAKKHDYEKAIDLLEKISPTYKLNKQVQRDKRRYEALNR